MLKNKHFDIHEWLEKLCNRVVINCKYIFTTSLRIVSACFSIATVALAFVAWEDLGLTDLRCKILTMIIVLLIAVFVSFLYTMLKRRRILWSSGGRTIEICYQDILKLASSKIHSSHKNIIIPVNTSFDTIVDRNLEQPKPLVSSESLHGSWIEMMLANGHSIEELDEKIEQYLQANYPDQGEQRSKPRGKQYFYPYGTTVVLNGENNTTFFLLAISEFDENNVTNNDREKYRYCLNSILDYTRKHGQGYDLYIPLMGTKLSGVNLSHKEAIEIIKAALLFHNDILTGNVTIAIYPGDKDKASIYDA